MFIGILVGLVVIFAIISAFGGIIKKILEIISLIAKLCMCGGVAMLVFRWLNIEFDKQWVQLLCTLLGAGVMFGLLMWLSGSFRMVGYSINYFINSIIILIVVQILGDKYEITFWMYAATLLLFPRLMWISDRLSTESSFSHTEYGIFGDTDVYLISDVDWWEDFGDAWGLIIVQILISSVFYLIGSLTMTAHCPVEQGWPMTLFIIGSLAVNLLFDSLIFRRIDEAI